MFVFLYGFQRLEGDVAKIAVVALEACRATENDLDALPTLDRSDKTSGGLLLLRHSPHLFNPVPLVLQQLDDSFVAHQVAGPYHHEAGILSFQHDIDLFHHFHVAIVKHLRHQRLGLRMAFDHGGSIMSSIVLASPAFQAVTISSI